MALVLMYLKCSKANPGKWSMRANGAKALRYGTYETGGAAGVYQAVEATLQLRGEAGENQLPNVRRAMIQNLAGPASSAVTHLLEALDG